MARYVDGFVLPIPKKNLIAYREVAKACGKIWREYGALEYREYLADDVKPGVVTSFPQSVNLEAGEIVAFGWIAYRSRKERDEINEKVMQDPRVKAMDFKLFDFNRLVYGGFSSLVEDPEP